MASRAYGFGVDEGLALPTVRVKLASSSRLGRGDAVVLAGSGGSLGPDALVPTVDRGAATGALFGFIASFEVSSAATPNYNISYCPASTAMYANVVPFLPGIEYNIQSDGVLAAANIGNNFNLATIADCDTTTGLSTMQLSAASAATSQTAYQMTLTGILDDGQQSLTAGTPSVKVRINNIQAFPGFGGV